MAVLQKVNIYLHAVTYLINALPSNRYVNTVKNAIIEEAVFSVSVVTSRSVGWWSRDMCFLRVRSSAT
jgi:hypothetical protein